MRRRVSGWIAAAAALALLGGPVLAAPPDPRTLRLKGATFDPLGGPPETSLPPVHAHAAGVRGGYWVQFEGPITGADREALEGAGASVKGSVPMRALEVVMTEASRAAVEALPGVRSVLPAQPGLKLADTLREALASGDGERRLLLQVSLFPGEGEAAAGQLAGSGARVLGVEHGRAQSLAVVDVPAARVEALARAPLVRFLEPVYERRAHNDRGRFHSGATAVADDTFSTGLDTSLDGFDQSAGFQVRFGHLDGGMSFAHPDFQNGINNSWVTHESGASTTSGTAHGTHTAGSVIGDGGESNTVPATPPGSGSVSPDRFRGVVPEAALHHISFGNNYSDAFTLLRFSQLGVHVSTNSWGYCTRGACRSITDYNTNAAAWDDGIWDADTGTAGLQQTIVVFSAGNDGDGNSTGCSAGGNSPNDQVGTPGTAKNVITVAANETDRACNAYSDQVGDVIDFSSRGPVDPDGTGQGLFKPDVSHIGGDFVLSAEAAGSGGSGRDAPSACSNTGPNYRYEGGTSMSCPLTAGVAGMLVQDLVVNRSVPNPSPSLVKALLINGAVDLQPSGGCDYTFETEATRIEQGWGFVQAPASLYGPNGTPGQRNVHFENEVSTNAVATGETYQHTVSAPAGVPFKVSLVWTDYPATANSGSPLVVNDLDLEVVGPQDTFYGNNFTGNWSVPTGTGAVRDRYNVVENVYLSSTVGGSYDVIVRGQQVSQDQEPDKTGVNQDFSLVWSFPARPACDDGLDNDGDGRVDWAGGDPGCASQSDDTETSDLLVCDNGVDDDGDGFIDTVDPACSSGNPYVPDPNAPAELTQCQDGVDNDGEVGTDFDGGESILGVGNGDPEGPDPQCSGRPWKNRERSPSVKRCGVGFELVLVLLPLGGWLSRARRGS